MNSYKWPLMKDTITFSDKLAMIKFIATTNQFTNGPKVREFEDCWNKWLGSKQSLFVSSGSTANLLLIDAVKEKYDLHNFEKVLVPACTWVTNISPVIQCGLTPIFCDVNLENYSFDIEHMKKIAVTHPDIKAIFVTHLLGYSADIEKYREIFPNAIILEDICESHGCLAPDGSKRGANAIGSTFSFYFGHHMTTVEGGMVSTNDPDLYNLMRIKRSHGLARELPREKFSQAIQVYPEVDSKFMFLTKGYNFRNTEIPAVLGINQLKRLDKMIAVRKKNYSTFYNIISEYQDHFYVPTDSTTNSSFAFPIVAKNKTVADRFKSELELASIESRPIVSGNLLMQPFLNDYSIEPGSNLNVQKLHENGVYVGNNHFIGNFEISLLSDVFVKSLR